jgi:Transposase DNA-binding/Transposase Tn5 dimerisation domain
MLSPWVIEEMKTADLNDKRLNERLNVLLTQLSERPTASIPAACGGHAEMTAAYRFFDNEKATFDNILLPHVQATRERIAGQAVVVLVQDTTEVDLTRPEQVVQGAGPLDGTSRVGALLHVLHAFTPDGTPLGTISARAWTRDAKKVPCALMSRAERLTVPIEEKESYRWVTTLHEAQELATACPSARCICVADSEADIYELLAEAAADSSDADWIVRGAHDRALCSESAAASSAARLRQQLLATPVLFTQTIHIRGRKTVVAQETRRRRQSRQSRDAEVSVRAARVTLRPPWRADRKLSPVSVNVVLVCEQNPPPGETAVEWLLLTSLPIAELEQVRQVIQYYCTRWMVEIFFRVLKSGCRVEQRRFKALDRLLTCLAIYLIVTWRTLYVCRLGRSCPEVSCEVVFEPAEWKATWKVIRGKNPPRKAPPLGEMIHWVAELGGYVTRSDSAPGPQTVWLGLQRVHDFAKCWKMFGPDTRRRHLHV